MFANFLIIIYNKITGISSFPSRLFRQQDRKATRRRAYSPSNPPAPFRDETAGQKGDKLLTRQVKRIIKGHIMSLNRYNMTLFYCFIKRHCVLKIFRVVPFLFNKALRRGEIKQVVTG